MIQEMISVCQPSKKWAPESDELWHIMNSGYKRSLQSYMIQHTSKVKSSPLDGGRQVMSVGRQKYNMKKIKGDQKSKGAWSRTGRPAGQPVCSNVHKIVRSTAWSTAVGERSAARSID